MNEEMYQMHNDEGLENAKDNIMDSQTKIPSKKGISNLLYNP
jgi:hypothetical protein